MSNISMIRSVLEGKRLLGYMSLKKNEFVGDWDNAIALYTGYPEDITCHVLYCQNQDYAMYDYWDIKTVPLIERDIRYKAIGEIIDKIDENDIGSKEWQSGDDVCQFEVKTKTYVLKFGHQWIDCHYPKSIWEVI